LRFLVKGAEVWAFEDCHEIVLLPDDQPFPVRGPKEDVKADEVKGEEGDVFWDPRPAEAKQKERDEQERKAKAGERVRRALIVSKFGFVV
jgi:hypothetical protein